MNILVTGSKGFIGENLVCELRNRGFQVFEYDKDSRSSDLELYTLNCSFVFNLAGVNRPKDKSEFMNGNFSFTDRLLTLLKKYNNKSTILLTSSIQADYDNDYGKSKKAGENLLFEYTK